MGRSGTLGGLNGGPNVASKGFGQDFSTELCRLIHVLRHNGNNKNLSDDDSQANDQRLML